MVVSDGNDQKSIVIIGGGIIGCATAYYLTRHPTYDFQKHKITVLEATRIAGGASGKAGGLLAVWAYPNNIVPLSFKLHQDLALEHGGEDRWGYRQVSCGNIMAQGRRQGELEYLGAQSGLPLGKRGRRGDVKKGGKGWSGNGMPKDLDWIIPDVVRSYEKMGGSRETAQVHPYQFTGSLMKLAEEKGAKLVIGHVTDLNYSEVGSDTLPPLAAAVRPGKKYPPGSSISSSSSRTRRKIQSITYVEKGGEERYLTASHVIIAAGPWTGRLFPSVPITGLRAHSVTITPASPVSAYALFTEITTPSSSKTAPGSPNASPSSGSPEIYARPNNEIYVCGEGDVDSELPETTADVEVDEKRCNNLIAQVSSISEHIRLGRVTRKQACYLPVVDVGGSGGPLIGETRVEGLLLASGHSCWGINNAPATGLLISEIVYEGRAKSADIRQLDPRRIL